MINELEEFQKLNLNDKIQNKNIIEKNKYENISIAQENSIITETNLLEKELEENSRSRSAKLRIVEKV